MILRRSSNFISNNAGVKDKHQRFINIASSMAMEIEAASSARIVALIVNKFYVVASGYNQMKSHPFQAKYAKSDGCIYLHAEINAIKKALKVISQEELSACTLYIGRIKFTDSSKSSIVSGLAKPCAGCEMAIAEFDIKNVYYSLDNEGYDCL